MRIFALVAHSALLLTIAAGTAWAAPPAAKDTTPPATISSASLVTHPRNFAIGVDFTAVGDDGTTGTAAGYDVYWQASTGSCGSPAPNLAGWTRSERSDLVIPNSAGLRESIPVRPLVPGTPYCVAVKARDEAGLVSPQWAVASAATLDGPWTPLSEAVVPPMSGTPTFINRLRATTDGDAQMQLAWTEMSGIFSGDIQGVGFATAPTVGAGSPVMYGPALPIRTWIDSFYESYVARPSSSAAASGDTSLLVFGSAPSTSRKDAVRNRLLLIERSGGTVSASVVATGSDQTGGVRPAAQSVSFGYTNDGAGGSRAAITMERINSKTSSVLDTSIVLLERNGTTWTESELLRRSSALSANTGNVNNFEGVNLVSMSNGDLQLLAVACSRAVLMRRPAGATVWEYYDAGSHPDFAANLVSAEGQGGSLVVARGNGTWVRLARLDAPMPAGSALPGKPAATCNASWIGATSPAWENVALGDGTMDYVGIRGVGETVTGSIQVLYYLSSSTPGGSTAGLSGFEHESRAATRCAAADWRVEKLDRGVRTGWGAVLDGYGNVLYASAWGRGNTNRLRASPAEKIYVGVRDATPDCGP